MRECLDIIFGGCKLGRVGARPEATNPSKAIVGVEQYILCSRRANFVASMHYISLDGY